MRVIVDQGRCIASGQCAFTVPEVFDQRESDGIVYLLNDNPPPQLDDDVRRAAALCPSRAITVVEE